MSFFAPGGIDVDNAALQVLVSGTPVLAVAFIGMGIGVVSKRWGPPGAWVLTLGSLVFFGLVFFGALAVLLSALEAWQAIGTWRADKSVTTLAVVRRQPSRWRSPPRPSPGSAASSPDRRGGRPAVSTAPSPVGNSTKGPQHGCWGPFGNGCPAASYSPTPSPGQYHRR